MKRTTSLALAPAVLVGLLVVVSAGIVLAQSQGREAESGSTLYNLYCASCHGTNGHGNGSIAIFLRVPPADLTQIAKRNKGVFPAERVYQIIDGRKIVKPHGESQMPVWGDAFMKSATTGGDEKAVSAKIQALVTYLQSIQEKPAR
jgi:mono/diheme cytochrome c family protein